MRGLICVLGCLAGCGSGDRSCTPEGQDIDGTELVIDQVGVPDTVGSSRCMHQLIRTQAELSEALGIEPPAELVAVDFAVDRVVYAPDPYPYLCFAVDNGTEIVVGLSNDVDILLPNSCVGFILRGTSRDSVVLHQCPHRAQ